MSNQAFTGDATSMSKSYEKIIIAGRQYQVGKLNKQQREQLPLFILSVIDSIPNDAIDGSNNCVEFWQMMSVLSDDKKERFLAILLNEDDMAFIHNHVMPAKDKHLLILRAVTERNNLREIFDRFVQNLRK
jgi:hypothetical protein